MPAIDRTRPQPKSPRRAVLAGSPAFPAAPVADEAPEAVEAPKKAARKRAPKSEVTDE
jgi:hypothetical protein